MNEADRIREHLAAEMERAEVASRAGRIGLADFRAALKEPEAVEVQFSGGVVQTCWAVTRRNGPYRVVWMPRAGYFSLCVEGPFGPLDIGVHGSAIDCFGSV